MNCGKASQIAKPGIRAAKAGFGRKTPDSGRFPEIFEDFGRKKHGIDTRRGGFGGFSCSVFLFALAFRDSQRIVRRADFEASGGFSEVGRFF